MFPYISGKTSGDFLIENKHTVNAIMVKGVQNSFSQKKTQKQFERFGENINIQI